MLATSIPDLDISFVYICFRMDLPHAYRQITLTPLTACSSSSVKCCCTWPLKSCSSSSMFLRSASMSFFSMSFRLICHS